MLAGLTLAACEEQGCVDRAGHVCALAGTGELGFNKDGLAPAATDLFLVSAARRGPDDLIWIMDFNNQRLRRIGADGLVETIVGNGFHAIATVGVPLLDTPLENPVDFAFLGDGRAVFVSYHDPRVLAVDGDGTLQVLAGSPDAEVGVIGDEGDGGPPLGALFMQLEGLAVADDDAIYVVDSLANRVRKIADGVVTTVAGTGEAGFMGDGGPATAAGLHWPSALALADDGDLYIADTFNHAVRRIAGDGTLTTVAGTGVEGSDGDGGPATAARLSQPYGVAVAADGAIYFTDRGNFKVRRVAPDGVIDTIAGTGERGSEGDDGPATAASFGHLGRVALDGDSLLVADQSNSRVRRVVLP